MKRSFRTFNESIAHAGTLAISAVRPTAFREQQFWDYGPGHRYAWRDYTDFFLSQLGYAWDALMCGIKGHDMRCAADAESGHTEHWCERCGYSFNVWM